MHNEREILSFFYVKLPPFIEIILFLRLTLKIYPQRYAGTYACSNHHCPTYAKTRLQLWFLMTWPMKTCLSTELSPHLPVQQDVQAHSGPHGASRPLQVSDAHSLSSHLFPVMKGFGINYLYLFSWWHFSINELGYSVAIFLCPSSLKNFTTENFKYIQSEENDVCLSF